MIQGHYGKLQDHKITNLPPFLQNVGAIKFNEDYF